jgi:hypothetical protein
VPWKARSDSERIGQLDSLEERKISTRRFIRLWGAQSEQSGRNAEPGITGDVTTYFSLFDSALMPCRHAYYDPGLYLLSVASVPARGG